MTNKKKPRFVERYTTDHYAHCSECSEVWMMLPDLRRLAQEHAVDASHTVVITSIVTEDWTYRPS